MVGSCENGVVGSDLCGIGDRCAILENKGMVGAEDPERIKYRDHKQREVVDVFRFISKCLLMREEVKEKGRKL